MPVYPTALRRCCGVVLLLGFLLIFRDDAQQTLTSVPAGSTINVSVSVQPATGGKTLSYQWRATDGTVANVNASSTTWIPRYRMVLSGLAANWVR